MCRLFPFLLMAGCALSKPIEVRQLIERARVNEIAAVEAAVGYQFVASGTVTDLSYYRAGQTEMNPAVASKALGVGTSAGEIKSAQRRDGAPYADIAGDDGTPVRCWFSSASHAIGFAKGQRATFVGWFNGLRKGEESFHVSLTYCSPQSPAAFPSAGQ